MASYSIWNKKSFSQFWLKEGLTLGKGKWENGLTSLIHAQQGSGKNVLCMKEDKEGYFYGGNRQREVGSVGLFFIFSGLTVTCKNGTCLKQEKVCTAVAKRQSFASISQQSGILSLKCFRFVFQFAFSFSCNLFGPDSNHSSP